MLKITEILHLALGEIRPNRHIQLMVDIGHYIKGAS
jgi:hypothetical protein